MIQLYLFIVILIMILFLMYVYKKKCDEDYYISLIHFTQQQCQYYFFPQKQYNFRMEPPQNYLMYNPQNYYPNCNQINYNDGFHTPKRKKKFQIYKSFSSPSPACNINYTNNQFIREKIVLNSNNRFDNNYFAENKNDKINKKVFKLEDFFTDSK